MVWSLETPLRFNRGETHLFLMRMSCGTISGANHCDSFRHDAGADGACANRSPSTATRSTSWPGFGRGRMVTIQELADEAFADVLKKHGIPVDPKDGPRNSATFPNTAAPQ